jgi:hypothetical protein
VIRDVVVHLLNEQPVLVDLFQMPKNVDNGLVCTNLRTLDGRKPIFIDRSDSVFFFPYLNVRFIEILRGREGAPGHEGQDAGAELPGTAADEGDLEIDEDFLRRVREA